MKSTKEKTPQSSRRRGWEARVALWAVKHPASVLVPGALGAGAVEWGPGTVGALITGTAASLAAWRRWGPSTFDHYASPVLRSWRRRWLTRSYLGPWWNDIMAEHGLTKEDKSGETKAPRVLRVRAASPSMETVYVRYLVGQSPRMWIDKLPELTMALKAERVVVQHVRPMVLALIIQRKASFAYTIPAPDMPGDAAEIDYSSIYLGEDEYGREWREPLQGEHWLIAGASGSGKGSVTWDLLRGLAPAIRDGHVRLWGIDPKQLELSAGRPIFYRYADSEESAVEVLREFVADMEATQKKLAEMGIRKATPSAETPLNLLIVDELAAILAYGTPNILRETNRLMALIGSMGRATGHLMHGAVQEPTKSVLGIRDLFTRCICLRVTSAGHVDMVLGEGARERGALADEIPGGPDTAGTGYRLIARTRTPMQVRAAYTSDADITELVTFVTSGTPRHLHAVPDAA